MTTLNINDSNEKSSNQPDYVELMPTWGYSASAFALFLIGFFGFFLNLMVIILMCKDKKLWTPLNVILFNLVCSDFSVSILGNPFTLISALSHRWIFGGTMCVIYGFFMTLLGITSITTLTVLSFERYIMVSKPLSPHRLTMKGASYTVGLIWCYSLAVTTPPLFGWGSYVSEGANISCSINWEEQSTNALTYILFLFAMGLIFPVIIITFSYVNIIKTMKKNSVRMGRVQKAESRVTVMVLVMILTFMMAWTPYSILALIEQFAPRDIISPGLGVIPALVAKSSICYDPIIYVGMNTQYRASLNRFFGFGDKEDSVHDRFDNTAMSPTRGISQVNTAENNVTLHCMNPADKSVLVVSKYQEEELGINTKNNTNKSSENAMNKGGMRKITIIPNVFDENSSELSYDSYVKDFPSSETSKPLTPINLYRKSIRSSNMEPSSSTKKDIDYNNKIIKCGVDDIQGSDAKDMLLIENKNDCGMDNFAASIMDECDFSRLLDGNAIYKSTTETPESDVYKKKKLPQRRQTISSTVLFKDTIDNARIADRINRRKGSTSGVGSNYVRKFSITQDSRNITNRLRVDERDMSKLINIDDSNSN